MSGRSSVKLHALRSRTRTRTSARAYADPILQQHDCFGGIRVGDTQPEVETRHQTAAARDGGVDQRPWPAPSHAWVGAQSWQELLFAHWPIPIADMRRAVPSALPLDTYDGQAWLGIVPFTLRRLRLRGQPPATGLSFLEVNVRTYVTLGGKPGVFFFSLDATNPLAVVGGRVLSLPYYLARIGMRRRGELIDYISQRVVLGRQAQLASLRVQWRPVGPAAPAAPDSLAHWLTERYCLYTMSAGGPVRRLEIAHPPWLLRSAEAEFAACTLTTTTGLKLPDTPPLLHYSRRQDVVSWAPRIVDARFS
jgi:uncharacterized protein